MHYANGSIDKFVEKPSDVFNKDRGTGYYIVSKEAFSLLSEIDQDKKDIIDIFNHAISMNHKAIPFVIAEEEFNINTLQQLNRAMLAFEKHRQTTLKED